MTVLLLVADGQRRAGRNAGVTGVRRHEDVFEAATSGDRRVEEGVVEHTACQAHTGLAQRPADVGHEARERFTENALKRARHLGPVLERPSSTLAVQPVGHRILPGWIHP